MYLGIEIGATKLQLGVGNARDPALIEQVRLDARPEREAQGILEQIADAAKGLCQRHDIRAIGVGFGGPVDPSTGRTVTSHQVSGWNDFPLGQWCRDKFARPVVIGNDSDAAGLAEARLGAGKGSRIVFYTNVGSGIGGALVIDGQLHRGARGIAMEPGHLRPGVQCDLPEQTVESIASGWAIAEAVRWQLDAPVSHRLDRLRQDERPLEAEALRQRLIENEDAQDQDADDLLTRCGREPEALTTRTVVEAAGEGNEMARAALDRACQAFGWAVAQVITVAAPDLVVVGGGVSLAGEMLFFEPVRRYVSRYVFPPLAGSYEIVPAALGEQVVVYGALVLAAEAAR